MTRRGFTLLEIVIVLLILGIVLQLAISAFTPALDERRLSSAAQSAVAALDYARSASEGATGRVTFDVTNNRFYVERLVPSASLLGNEATLTQAQVETTSSSLMLFPSNPSLSYITSFQDARYSGVKLISATFGAASAVTFNALGTPSAGGTVVFGLNTRRYTLTLNAVTGETSLSSP